MDISKRPNIRLTLQIRNETLHSIMKTQFPEETTEAWEARFAKLGEKVYNKIYSASVRKKMRSLPDGWLPSAKFIRFIVAGYVGDRNNWSNKPPIGDVLVRLPENKKFVFPDQDVHLHQHHFYPQDADRLLRLEIDNPLNHEFMSITNERREKSEERAAARVAAEEMLKQCRTYKQLCQRWPEAAKFVPDWVFKTETLPSVPIKTLNEMLGLDKK